MEIEINKKYSVRGWDENEDLVIMFNTNDFLEAKMFARMNLIPRTDIVTVMVVDTDTEKGISF